MKGGVFYGVSVNRVCGGKKTVVVGNVSFEGVCSGLIALFVLCNSSSRLVVCMRNGNTVKEVNQSLAWSQDTVGIENCCPLSIINDCYGNRHI